MKKYHLLLLLLVPPPYGGGENRGLRMAKYFCQRDGVRTLTFSRPWASKYTQGRVTFRNFFYGLYYIGRSARYMVTDRPEKMFFSIPKNIAAFLRMVPLIYLAQFLRIKVCGELAGANFLFLEEGGWKKAVGVHFLRKFYSIRFLGASVAKHHDPYGFKNTVVFPNGMEHPCVRSSVDYLPDSARLELLYVGELSRSKGVERIIHALRRCRTEGLDVCCTLIGEWKEAAFEREMQDFIRQNRLDTVIAFTGLLKGNEKWAFYSKAHVLTHPTDLDGQPITILEAMGSGLAVISTHVGAIPDTIKDGVNGYLLPEISAEALYEAIRKLYFDRTLLQRMRTQNAQAFKERYELSTYLGNVARWLF
jgi:glycosyltransferase involved in cell wall biosynthesis